MFFTKHESRNTNHGIYVFHESRDTNHESRLFFETRLFPWLVWCLLVLKPFSLVFSAPVCLASGEKSRFSGPVMPRSVAQT